MKKWVMSLATVMVFGAVLAAGVAETTPSQYALDNIGGPVQTAPTRG